MTFLSAQSAWHPEPIETVELSDAQLEAMAEEDGYELYNDVLPFAEWDCIEGEEATATWLEAARKIAAADYFGLYESDDNSIGEKAAELAETLQAENMDRAFNKQLIEVKAIQKVAEWVTVPELKAQLNRILSSDEFTRFAEYEAYTGDSEFNIRLNKKQQREALEGVQV